MLECLSEDPAQRPTAEQLVRRLRPRRPAGSQHGSSVSLAGLGSLALGEEEEQGRQRSA